MKNWRTTLIGIAGAVGIILAKIFSHQSITPGDITMAVTSIAMGGVAKDSVVTGGTKAATPEAAERIASK